MTYQLPQYREDLGLEHRVAPFTGCHQQIIVFELPGTYCASTLSPTWRTPSTPLPDTSSSASGSSLKSESFEKLLPEFLRSGGGYEAVHGGDAERIDDAELDRSTGNISGDSCPPSSVGRALGVNTIRRTLYVCFAVSQSVQYEDGTEYVGYQSRALNN